MIYARALDSGGGTIYVLSVCISDCIDRISADFSRLESTRDREIECINFCHDCRIIVARSLEDIASPSADSILSIIGTRYSRYEDLRELNAPLATHETEVDPESIGRVRKSWDISPVLVSGEGDIAV